MITLTVTDTVHKSLLQLFRSGLVSGLLTKIFAVMLIFVCLFMFLGSIGTMDTGHRHLPVPSHILRSLAVACAIIACLLLPVMYFTLKVELIRDVSLASAGLKDLSARIPAIDSFLYDGLGGDQTLKLASGMLLEVQWPYWLTMLPLLGLLTASLSLHSALLSRALGRVGLYAFVILLIVIILYPYYVMLVTGFRDNAESTDMNFLHLFPTRWVWSNLGDIVDRGVLTYLMNSILLSFGATAIALLCGIPAAYALSRMRFRGQKSFLGFVIMSQMFAPVVLLVGISTLLRAMNLNDSLWGLIFINAAFNQAFAIWLLRGTFTSISPEMEQAACIDGCNIVSALIRVLLPMAMPGIVTTLIFIFINAWNEYTIATVIISTPAKRPITVGITQFSSFNMIEWQYLFATALLATVPVVILFMLIERHLVEGLTAGGVKG